MIFVVCIFGCNSWEVFRFIIFLNLKIGIIFVIVMIWLRVFGEFGVVVMIVGFICMKIEIIFIFIYLNMFIGDIDIVIGIVVILIFFLFICLMFFEIFFNREVDKN